MDQKPNDKTKKPSKWESIKQQGLEKIKTFRKKVQEKAKPLKEGLKEAGEGAKEVGRTAKAMYWDYPKYVYEEMTKEEEGTNERKKPKK